MATRTLTRYLLEAREGAQIVNAMAVTVRRLATAVSRGPLILDAPSGDPVELRRELYRQATETLLDQVTGIAEVSAVAVADEAGSSEVHVMSEDPLAPYLVLLEVNLGSSKLVENQPVGLTFSVKRRANVSSADFLDPENATVCAGMGLLGPSTVLIVTTGEGVEGFTLDRQIGSFVLTHPQMRLPADSDVLSVDLSTAHKWPHAVRRYVDERIESEGRKLEIRWNNSALIGAYRILLNGGIFMMPDTGLRMVQGADALATIMEQAGGRALKLESAAPDSLDCRTPIIFGDSYDIGLIERYTIEEEQGYTGQANSPLFHNRSLYFSE